jgi:hypothetical protein
VATFEEIWLAGLFESAEAKILSGREDLRRDALHERLEDVAMLRAIQSGEKTRLVTRKEIFRHFERSK